MLQSGILINSCRILKLFVNNSALYMWNVCDVGL